MAQSDLTIQNQSFPSFRSDLNDALTALNSTQSGTSRPSSAVAGTIWLDTTNATNPTLKLYDGSDDISLATLDYSANTVNWLDSTVVADLVNDTTPQLGGMLDVNGNAIGNGTEELIKFSETASAVNEVTVTNSATSNAPELSATGDDTNIDLKLTPKGSGNLVLDGIKFPNADGTSGQALQTDGSGNLSFADVGGGITEADQWRLTTDTNTSTNADITTNWERVDNTGWGSIGTGMTESSGIFSFPSTGIYLINFEMRFIMVAGDATAEVDLYITVDNSSYTKVASAGVGNSGSSNTSGSSSQSFIFDVTNITTHKIKFATDSISTNTKVSGNTNENKSGVTFIRLGDT